MVLFYAAVLMLLILNLSQIAPVEGSVPAPILKFCDAELEPNLIQMKFQKGSCIKIHKCLVGILP